MYLEKINSPKDIKNMKIEELEILATEMRKALVRKGDILVRTLVW